ncbi:response regulator transcription factor [Spirosoma sp. BT702]|uniref:Response regulator transcription factor n=1 Tax=Spirosoma profusum TaxID=2771354 RepID=A0A927ARX7_9BACT|nr:LytTR family DNA-binding domain-containing protein [Spirosoma profusum]MBD2700380.1 response regulator transcription factor [Spirosoma profusum]
MKKVACLIVDDEPIAREIIETYCRHLPQLTVVASCDTTLDAKTMLQKQPIDILFLDINMPVLNGIAFLKTLKNQPQVIFTTAYKEYAVDAFDLSACDYLLKPFSLERFIVAIDKALERLHPAQTPINVANDAKPDDFTFVKADGKIYKIRHEELLFAEANGNYTRINTTNGTLTPGMTFSSFISLLPVNQFIQVHRSFVVNKAKISHIEGNRVFIGSTEIPIGSNYRDGFFKELGV